MPNFSIYISDSLKAKLDEAVAKSKKSRNKIITEAIKRALDKQ